MPSQNSDAVAAFVEGAPPGELDDVIADIKSLTVEEPQLLQSAAPAFQKYNEEQLSTVKLPGESQKVLISQYNSLGDGRYYDVESSSSFAFDHASQKASDVQSYSVDSKHSELIKSLLKALATHTAEHYPSGATYGVFPTDSDAAVAILIVANKYSPSNFWNGRWRSAYHLTPGSGALRGRVHADVHYYEDGNVRLTAAKPMELTAGTTAPEIGRAIGRADRAYQEELNRGLARLSEGAFKALRRQLPVTRQKVDWDKIGGYRLGQDIGGGKGR